LLPALGLAPDDGDGAVAPPRTLVLDYTTSGTACQ